MENTMQVENSTTIQIYRVDAIIMKMTKAWDNVDKNLLERILEIKNSQ